VDGCVIVEVAASQLDSPDAFDESAWLCQDQDPDQECDQGHRDEDRAIVVVPESGRMESHGTILPPEPPLPLALPQLSL
jgi:hypothetical protein